MLCQVDQSLASQGKEFVIHEDASFAEPQGCKLSRCQEQEPEAQQEGDAQGGEVIFIEDALDDDREEKGKQGGSHEQHDEGDARLKGKAEAQTHQQTVISVISLADGPAVKPHTLCGHITHDHGQSACQTGPGIDEADQKQDHRKKTVIGEEDLGIAVQESFRLEGEVMPGELSHFRSRSGTLSCARKVSRVSLSLTMSVLPLMPARRIRGR